MSGFIPHSGYRNLRWPEVVSTILLIMGFILSLLTGSAVMYYIVAFLTGMFFGRIWYQTRNTLQFKYLMMIVFFMLGFILGNYLSHYGDPRLTILIFFLGIVASYYLHNKKYIRAIDF